MTGKHLPPDTGREISTLKRRVSDLERVLDRVRRRVATPAPDPLAPFSSIHGSGSSTGGLHTTTGAWHYYQPANTIDRVIADPTHHIGVGDDDSWEFRIAVAAVYQIGVAVAFDETGPGGDRTVAIQQVDNSGTVATHHIATVPSAVATVTRLSGSVIVYAAAGSRWWPMYGDDTGVAAAGSAATYWCQAVALTGPPPGPPLEG